MDRLFTYGSLQPGGPNAHLLDGLEGEWQEATVVGRQIERGWGADMGYPALQLDDEGDIVSGYVFTSHDLARHWDRLDDFEGREYRRARAHVRLGHGESVTAHVYVLREASRGW